MTPRTRRVRIIRSKADRPDWSNGKKLFMTALLGLYTASVYICSAIYTPGIGIVETDFNADETEATLGLTLFVFGYSIAPLVLTPITMLPEYGRRNPYFISVSLACSARSHLASLSSTSPSSAVVLAFAIFPASLSSDSSQASPARPRSRPSASRCRTSGLRSRLLVRRMTSPRLILRRCHRNLGFARRSRARLTHAGSFATLGPILGPLIGAAAILHPGWETWRSPLWLLVRRAGAALMPSRRVSAPLH